MLEKGQRPASILMGETIGVGDAMMILAMSRQLASETLRHCFATSFVTLRLSISFVVQGVDGRYIMNPTWALCKLNNAIRALMDA